MSLAGRRLWPGVARDYGPAGRARWPYAFLSNECKPAKWLTFILAFTPMKVFWRFEVVVGLPRSDLEQVGRYCSHQYAALQQPEDFPTMSVKTEIVRLSKPVPSLSLTSSLSTKRLIKEIRTKSWTDYRSIQDFVRIPTGSL